MARTTLHWPTDAERRRVAEIIARHHGDRPDGVRRVTSAFGEDHEGSPAVFLEMVIGTELQPTKEKIEELNDYAQVLVNGILESDPDYFPYIRTKIDDE
jgi:hypothetical protein